MPNASSTQPDRQVLNLTKAIRQTESGGNYNAKGGSGESGAYQWMPNTWKAHAKQVLGDENAPMTRDNQNAVAYTIMKADRDSGLNPAQIAAKWNSGSPDGWENKRGVNSAGVQYDVPKYVKSVTDAYQKIARGEQVGMDPNNPSSLSGTKQGEVPKADNLANKLTARADQFNKAGGEDSYFGSSILGRVGAVAGGINDVIGATVSPLIGGTVNAISDIDAVQKFAGSKPVSGALDAINTTTQNVGEGYKQFEENNPKTGQFLRDTGNIASLVPIGKGAQLTKNAAIEGTKGVARTILPNASENIMNRVARLDPTDARKFESLAGESHGKYLSRTGNMTTAEEIIQNESKKFVQSVSDVDAAIAKLEGKFKNDAVTTALRDLAERESRIGVANQETATINRLLKQAETTGLDMSEINLAKRLYEKNVKLDYQKQNLPEGLARATRVDDALREWQFATAEKLGLKNLRELNKQTQLSKFIVDKLGKKVTGGTGNNAISLTDWIIMSGLDPSAIAGFLAKKAVFGQGGQARIARFLAKKPEGQIKPKYGGKTGLPALIKGRDYRTPTEMGAPKVPKTGIKETIKGPMNRSSLVEENAIKAKNEQKLLPAPKTRLPQSIRETNIGTDELRNAKIRDTQKQQLLLNERAGAIEVPSRSRTEGTPTQQIEKQKVSKASSIIPQKGTGKNGLMSTSKIARITNPKKLSDAIEKKYGIKNAEFIAEDVLALKKEGGLTHKQIEEFIKEAVKKYE